MPYGNGTGPRGKGGSGMGKGKAGGSGRGMGRRKGQSKGGLLGGVAKLFQFDFDKPQSLQSVEEQSLITKQREIEMLKQRTHILQQQLDSADKKTGASKKKKQALHLTAMIDEQYCNYCGICAEVCEHGAIVIDGTVTVSEELCTGCGICVAECPKTAITLIEG